MPRAQFAIPSILFAAALIALGLRFPFPSLIAVSAVAASVALALLSVAITVAFLSGLAAVGFVLPRARISIRAVMAATALTAVALAFPIPGALLIGGVAALTGLRWLRSTTAGERPDPTVEAAGAVQEAAHRHRI
jgi:hypothetical protein